MYPTGYTPRSGNFSNCYPKPGYETNMPSIHSTVPGTGYGATSPYRTSWGSQSISFENPGAKMTQSSEVFDSRSSVGKQVNGYSAESGWVCNSATDQRMCYGECKRSGRMCATCQEYAQYNYGMQTFNSRCSSQMVSAPYPQRHPIWQEGQTMAPQKFSPNNGYHLPRSNSEPLAYAMNGYNSSYQQTNSSHWGSKTVPPGDPIRRSNSWYNNGYSHGQHNQGRCAETDNWQSYRMSSCDINSQKMKAQMRPMAGGTMGPHHRNNAMTQQSSHFNSSMNWNNHMNIPEMTNSHCAISQDRLLSNRPTCANRPGHLQTRGCSFPTTPPSNAYGVVATSKPMGSCQLSQVPHPVVSSPPRPQRTATFWDGPSPITKQGVELEKFQYTSTNNEPSVGNTNSQFHQSNLNGQSPLNIAQTCPGIPQNCDLSARAWQNDIVDLNSTGCEVNDKARIFSAELEKLARLSQTFDGDELDFSNATGNTTVLPNTDTSGTSDAVRTNLAPSHVPTREESCFDEPVPSNTFSPRSTDFNNLEQNKLPCVSEANILPQQIHETNTQCGDTNHDTRPPGSSSVTSADSPTEEGDGRKLKTKHTDYLDQTSDVNPYGSQNCIAALSASCRKMIADMDKPEKDLDQSGQGQAVAQQPMCVPSFPDGSPNGITNSSCYGRPYTAPSHPHSFPVDPYSLHYPQVSHTSTLNGTVSEKSRRGRKRKNAVSRGSGQSVNRSYENQESCKKSLNAVAPSSQESFGKDFEGPPRSPQRHGSDTDLGNISPTFSDGPVSFDMLESVFSPDTSLPSSTNDFSTILETSNTHLSHSFSDFGHVSPPSVANTNPNNGNIVSSTRCLSTNVTSCQPASTAPNSKERHPLEILKDQIKIQRQQFSLDGPLENGPVDFNEKNNNKSDRSGELKSIHHDVNDNHVIEARS